jgi:hypothetical protein
MCVCKIGCYVCVCKVVHAMVFVVVHRMLCVCVKWCIGCYVCL